MLTDTEVCERVRPTCHQAEGPAASPPAAPWRRVWCITLALCALNPPQVLHCCAIIAPNQDVAFMLSIMWTTIQLLLSGFFVNFKEVCVSCARGRAPQHSPFGTHARACPTPADRAPAGQRGAAFWGIAHASRRSVCSSPLVLTSPGPSYVCKPAPARALRCCAQVFNGWITYLRFISATYYSLEAAAINEFDSVYLACGRGAGPAEVEFAKLAFPNTTPAAAGQLERLFKQAPGGACVLDARAVLRYFDFSRPFWASAALLGGYLAVCHALTFAAMLVAARRERR